MLGKVGNVSPGIKLFRRAVGACEKSFVSTRNGLVLDVEPSGAPVPDGLMRRQRLIHPLHVEHKGHSAAVDHDLLLHLLLHAIEELKDPDLWPDSEMTFTQRGEVGEKKIGVGEDIMGWQPISAKHL
jgi:hypothetical protein